MSVADGGAASTSTSSSSSESCTDGVCIKVEKSEECTTSKGGRKKDCTVVTLRTECDANGACSTSKSTESTSSYSDEL